MHVHVRVLFTDQSSNDRKPSHIGAAVSHSNNHNQGQGQDEDEGDVDDGAQTQEQYLQVTHIYLFIHPSITS